LRQPIDTKLHASYIAQRQGKIYMPSKTECDKYASELTQRFDELTRWAIANWPKKDFPLLNSDFAASRREISAIVGSRLGEGDKDGEVVDRTRDSGQYIETNPMPWP
jgi:hypothetical protein